MTQIVIQVKNKANFGFLVELLKQLPFVKSTTIETDTKKTKLLRLESEIEKSRKQYKEGKTISIEKLMQDV